MLPLLKRESSGWEKSRDGCITSVPQLHLKKSHKNLMLPHDRHNFYLYFRPLWPSHNVAWLLHNGAQYSHNISWSSMQKFPLWAITEGFWTCSKLTICCICASTSVKTAELRCKSILKHSWFSQVIVSRQVSLQWDHYFRKHSVFSAWSSLLSLCVAKGVPHIDLLLLQVTAWKFCRQEVQYTSG